MISVSLASMELSSSSSTASLFAQVHTILTQTQVPVQPVCLHVRPVAVIRPAFPALLLEMDLLLFITLITIAVYLTVLLDFIKIRANCYVQTVLCPAWSAIISLASDAVLSI